jgi:hypothetical protein
MSLVRFGYVDRLLRGINDFTTEGSRNTHWWLRWVVDCIV